MSKNKYQEPIVETLIIEAKSIMAVSGGTGATGEDVPWASRESSTLDESIWNDNDEI